MGVDLFFEITGRTDGPTVVLSHALGGDLSMWDAQAPGLAANYRILRYDLRGHGRSIAKNPSLTLADLGADVLALLNLHGIERAHFCGLSLGGMIGQWLGLHAQERLHSLVLVDSAPRMGTVEQWNERLATIERDGLAAISSATMSRWFTDEFREREPQTVERFKVILENTSPAGYMACAKVVRDAAVAGEDYRSITVPTLIVTGTYDSAASPSACQAMAADIPSARYVELKAAHLSPVEASGPFTRTLEEFLKEQRD